ncbi:MAG: DUF433 domain-containing protein, partial [Nanoarchaeota archaeon]|nr:DUF433 domain-containing protein [Nanoarchaeota archaeon]
MEKIIINPNIRHGKPIINGTRISVDEVLGALVSGMTYAEIEAEYGIKKEEVIAAISYAASLINNEEFYPLK